MTMRSDNARHPADLDDVSAQIGLIGVLWLMISEEPSAAPNGGFARACHDQRLSRCVLTFLGRER
jgi:hypothetical protein